MKKLFTLTLLAFTISASAQKVDFGVKIGFTAASLHGSYDGLSGNSNTINNIDLRACVDVDFGHVTIQPGLALYLKGGSGTDATPVNVYYNPSTGITTPTTTSQTSSTLLKITYLELPVNVLYNMPVKFGKFFIGGGPYIAAGLSAKKEISTINYDAAGTLSQNTTKSSVVFGNGQEELHRMDFGFNLLGGLRFKNGIDLGLGYGQGLTDVTNTTAIKAKNQTGSVTVGYFF